MDATRKASSVPHQANVYSTIDGSPLLSGPQLYEHVVEHFLVCRRVFKPGQKVERLCLRQVATVVQLSRDLRQALHADLVMVRPGLENLPPLVLRQRPPSRVLADRDECGAGLLGPAQTLLDGEKLRLFAALDITLIAGNAAQGPRFTECLLHTRCGMDRQSRPRPPGARLRGSEHVPFANRQWPRRRR